MRRGGGGGDIVYSEVVLCAPRSPGTNECCNQVVKPNKKQWGSSSMEDQQASKLRDKGLIPVILVKKTQS